MKVIIGIECEKRMDWALRDINWNREGASLRDKRRAMKENNMVNNADYYNILYFSTAMFTKFMSLSVITNIVVDKCCFIVSKQIIRLH